MSILAEILEGYKNLLIKDKNIENLATARAMRCQSCDKLSKTKNFYLFCKKCGCYIPAKIRSLESRCPINKW